MDYFVINDRSCPPELCEGLLTDIRHFNHKTVNCLFVTLNELEKNTQEIFDSAKRWEKWCEQNGYGFDWKWITNSCTAYQPGYEDKIVRINWFEWLTYTIHTTHNHEYNTEWNPKKEVLYIPGKMDKSNRYVMFEILAKYSGIFQDAKYSMILNKSTQSKYLEIFAGNMDFQFTGFENLQEIIELQNNLDIELHKSQNHLTFHYTGWPYDVNLYKDTGWSIVCETSSPEYDMINIHNAWLTEKTFRPIINKHPMIFADDFATLHYLKKLGYKTYEFLYAEYVELFDWICRGANLASRETQIYYKEKIGKCLREMQNKITDTKNYEKIKDITEHNYNTLINNAENTVIPDCGVWCDLNKKWIPLQTYLEVRYPYRNSASYSDQVEILPEKSN